jgi:hypothetical protein
VRHTGRARLVLHKRLGRPRAAKCCREDALPAIAD